MGSVIGKQDRNNGQHVGAAELHMKFPERTSYPLGLSPCIASLTKGLPFCGPV